MKRRSKSIRRTPLPARTARPKAVNRARRKRNGLRAYGPKERREWILATPCLTCGRCQPSEQSHLRSRSGAGRKGDADKVVPMCYECHGLYPRRSKWALIFPQWTDEALNAAAQRLADEWHSYSGGDDGE